MSKKNKGFIEKEIDRFNNYLKEQTIKGLKWSCKRSFNIQKRIIVNAGYQMKPDNLKQLFKSREKYIFFPVTLSTTAFLLYYTYNTEIPYISAIGLFTYFYGKGAVISAQDFYREM